MSRLQVVNRKISDLCTNSRNSRTHSSDQIQQIATSIAKFGFNNPVLIDHENTIIGGHGRVDAARALGLAEVPTILLEHLTDAEKRAYVIADNKLAENAGWNSEVLAMEFQALVEVGFDVELTGFSMTEIDLVIDSAAEANPDGVPDEADRVPEAPAQPVTRTGDFWKLGRHLLLCGDARKPQDFEKLMSGAFAAVAFTDPPYNVPINGHVCGLGRVKHREFAMASGEMSGAEYTEFLRKTLENTAANCSEGAIAFICIDWRHVAEISEAGRTAFTELKNICVWNKTNAGMGTFYRSKHELVFVFKKGTAPHVNNFGLGDQGRYRTNVWDYPGVNSQARERAKTLAMHPTVKPVALVADALRDCSNRGHVVLDPFAGSGTTLIAAHTCGRSARLIEYDPAYCDTIIRRFQELTGGGAQLVETGQDFDEVAEARRRGKDAQ